MQIRELLAEERILVDSDGGFVRTKGDALRLLAGFLSGSVGVPYGDIEGLLVARERLVSTGIGEGVAIPHTSHDDAQRQVAALLLCPKGVDFDAVDDAPVRIVFGVLGPKKAAGEHLRVLARISRLLRDAATREELVSSVDAAAAFRLIESHESHLR